MAGWLYTWYRPRFRMFVTTCTQWWRQDWAMGSPPQCRLAPTVKHTDQNSGGELCEIFKFWSFLQWKSVNNVCRLLQLRCRRPRCPWTPLDDFRPSVPWAIAPNENSWRSHFVYVVQRQVVWGQYDVMWRLVPLLYDFKAELAGTGDRSKCDIEV